MANRCLSYLVLFLALSATTANAHIPKCVYSIFVKTGWIRRAGTDSKIGLTLSDAGGRSFEIPNLQKWGLMEPGHDYYEKGNLDVFSGREKCLEPPICNLKLVSDRKGKQPGWFVEYVDIVVSNPDQPCSQVNFPVNKWIGVSGPPFEVTVLLDGCLKHAT